MKEEKIIKPANGYLMLFILITLLFGSIATAIRAEDPRFLIGTFISWFWFIHIWRSNYRKI